VGLNRVTDVRITFDVQAAYEVPASVAPPPLPQPASRAVFVSALALDSTGLKTLRKATEPQGKIRFDLDRLALPVDAMITNLAVVVPGVERQVRREAAVRWHSGNVVRDRQRAGDAQRGCSQRRESRERTAPQFGGGRLARASSDPDDYQGHRRGSPCLGARRSALDRIQRALGVQSQILMVHHRS
jgi:hypothetical protein